MRKVISLFLLFAIVDTYSQYNESVPWMNSKDELLKQKSTLETHSKAFNSYWKDHDQSIKGSGFKPFKRWENHWKNHLMKDGTLATPQVIWKSWQQKLELPQNSLSSWESLGPYTTNVKQGQGRVNTFIVDPNEPNTFYVGAPAGGIWKSTDAGINWIPLSDQIPQIGVSGIAIDKNNSQIIYIATGDDDARDTYSVGVLKSIDGGINWNKTGLDFSVINAVSNEIYIHPDNSDILWVSTNKGFFKSTDAGVSWTKRIATNILDFKLKPGNPEVIYAVSKSKFYKSTDGGESFVLIDEGLPDSSGRFAIDVSPANPDIVYVLSAKLDNTFQGLYKSTDSGNKFSKTIVSKDIFGGSTQAWYDMALTVNPQNADMVFVGVLDIWRSTNAGDLFVQKNRWWDPSEPSYTHADIHFLRYFNGILYAGTDGGIYASSDNAQSFTDLTENLNISQYYRISTAKSSSDKIAGGLQDNGGFAYSNKAWHQYHGGDGMDCAVDPNDDNIYYGFNQFGGLLNVTFNGGVTEGGSVTSAPSAETDGSNDSGGKWVTPLIADNKGDIYAGYSRIYKLADNIWEAFSPRAFGGDLDHMKFAPSNNDVIYVSRVNKLFKSIDHGANFEEVDFIFPTVISSIEINNQNENTIYISTAGVNGKLLKSQDAGITWEDITLNLPDDSKLIIRHQNQSLLNDLYLGTSIGVYHKNDDMEEWERYDEGLPNVPVYDLEINIEDEKISVGTYGRGVWQSPIKVSKADVDLSLLKINTNKSVQCIGITPEITIKNNGLNSFNSIDINYLVDDQPFTYTYTGIIQPGEIKEIQLENNPDISIGDHELTLEATVEDDAFSDNNTLYASFTTNNTGQGQYVNTFGDINSDDWLTITLGTSNQLWEKSIASSDKFKNKFDNVYVTEAEGNYSDETTSYLISPCYDLSKLENPILKFDMIYDIELNWDVLYMEYSINKGKSWQILGTADDPNWYNSNFIDPQRPITVGKQWTGTDIDVKEYSHNLADLNSETNVIFRFVFASDQAENGEGAAIDNFSIDASAILATDDFAKNNFQLYPNPSSSVFYIQRQGIEEMNISVYDVTGKLILEEKNITDMNYTLDLGKAHSGLYFLKIIEGKKQLSTTLLKQ